MRSIMDMDEDELQKLALAIIGLIDYDIEKELTWNIEENGFDTLVDEVAAFLISTFEQ